MASDWVFVAEAAAIAPGHYETIDIDGTIVAVFNVNGEFYAIEDVCTHDGTVLTSGNPIEGDEIVCPRHGARFCVRTGEALSPPAYEPTSTFPVKLDAGKVYVRDNRWD
jgi:3-phenylpropionate/trans-cinnamate dioxygenase ferredoxin subunit